MFQIVIETFLSDVFKMTAALLYACATFQSDMCKYCIEACNERFFKINFSSQKQGVTYYTIYVFAMSKFNIAVPSI